MTVQQRRERERAERQELIIRTARELAETDGWDAVTTRRLSQRIEYSQPVLYSHFANKDAIVAAVAEEGFAELARDLRAVRQAHTDRFELCRAMVYAYVGLAAKNPALYDAMFTMDVGLPFGQEDTPPALREGFEQLAAGLGALAAEDERGIFTEVAWAALHGLVTLTRDGRLPVEYQVARIDLLVRQLLS